MTFLDCCATGFMHDPRLSPTDCHSLDTSLHWRGIFANNSQCLFSRVRRTVKAVKRLDNARRGSQAFWKSCSWDAMRCTAHGMATVLWTGARCPGSSTAAKRQGAQRREWNATETFAVIRTRAGGLDCLCIELSSRHMSSGHIYRRRRNRGLPLALPLSSSTPSLNVT